MKAGSEAFRAAVKQCDDLGARCVGLYDSKCDVDHFTICNGSSFGTGSKSSENGCAYEKRASEHALGPPL